MLSTSLVSVLSSGPEAGPESGPRTKLSPPELPAPVKPPTSDPGQAPAPSLAAGPVAVQADVSAARSPPPSESRSSRKKLVAGLVLAGASCFMLGARNSENPPRRSSTSTWSLSLVPAAACLTCSPTTTLGPLSVATAFRSPSRGSNRSSMLQSSGWSGPDVGRYVAPTIDPGGSVELPLWWR